MVSKRTKILLALIVGIAILVLFILPAFDVDPTALRAARAAELLLLSIACAAFAIFALRSERILLVELAPPFIKHTSDLLEETCSLLC